MGSKHFETCNRLETGENSLNTSNSSIGQGFTWENCGHKWAFYLKYGEPMNHHNWPYSAIKAMSFLHFMFPIVGQDTQDHVSVTISMKQINLGSEIVKNIELHIQHKM